jgi:hypothetical protein
MSTLEELKKQASEVTQRGQVAAANKAGADQPSEEEKWRKLSPVMNFLKDHFVELAETLNVLNKEILVDFEINDSITLKNLQGQNYKITHPEKDIEKEKHFVFEFENVGENPTYCVVPAGPAASSFKKLLTDNQAQCSTTPVDSNKSIKFEIKAMLRTKYLFSVDLEKDCISLKISNYSNFWSQVNAFKKNEITTDLMDELTRHVMREPNKYNEMVGNVISDDMRTQIKDKLKAEQTAQQIHAEKNQIEQAKKESGKKEKTIFGRLFKK